jgi:glucosamine--fructose-6-phosphate aminotransferase (isomerizing)
VEETVKPYAMLDDILRQPESLRRAWQYQLNAGSEAMVAARRTIASAQRVVLTGMGSSLFAAIPAAYDWEQHGVAVEYIETSELLHFRHAALNPQTAVVVISRSGESVEALKLLPLLDRSGAKLIGVTNVGESTLARSAPVCIQLNCANDRMVAVQSYTSSVAVLLLLAAGGRGDLFNIDDLCQRVAGTAQSAVAGADEWAGFLTSGAIYFLARGPSLASAHESALLLHEAARTPCIAMSGPQFRHGPVEAAGPNIRAVVFPSPSTRELDLDLATDLEQMGSLVRICDEGQRAAHPFAPLIEIIPVQAAACALAQSKGIDPGDFRYASLVTSSEAGFR